MTKNAEDTEAIRILLTRIYNAYRTAQLNKSYYQRKLAKFKNIDIAMEIVIALGATGSSGIAGLAIWGTRLGNPLWLVFSGSAAVLCVIKPILQLGSQIKKNAELTAKHSHIYLELKTMVDVISLSHNVDAQIYEKFSTISQTMDKLAEQDAESAPDKKLILRLQAEVNRSIPPESLWMPQ